MTDTNLTHKNNESLSTATSREMRFRQVSDTNQDAENLQNGAINQLTQYETMRYLANASIPFSAGAVPKDPNRKSGMLSSSEEAEEDEMNRSINKRNDVYDELGELNTDDDSFKDVKTTTAVRRIVIKDDSGVGSSIASSLSFQEAFRNNSQQVSDKEYMIDSVRNSGCSKHPKLNKRELNEELQNFVDPSNMHQKRSEPHLKSVAAFELQEDKLLPEPVNSSHQVNDKEGNIEDLMNSIKLQNASNTYQEYFSSKQPKGRSFEDLMESLKIQNSCCNDNFVTSPQNRKLLESKSVFIMNQEQENFEAGISNEDVKFIERQACFYEQRSLEREAELKKTQLASIEWLHFRIEELDENAVRHPFLLAEDLPPPIEEQGAQGLDEHFQVLNPPFAEPVPMDQINNGHFVNVNQVHFSTSRKRG